MRLLIACGNSLRQDDGAGLILGQRLAAAWQRRGLTVRYLEVQQLLPELALAVADAAVDEVWFVDTRLAAGEGDGGVEIRPLTAVDPSPAIGHQLSPEMVLLYARLFAERQPPAWQITLPGFAFGHADTPTAACWASLEAAWGHGQWEVMGCA